MGVWETLKEEWPVMRAAPYSVATLSSALITDSVSATLFVQSFVLANKNSQIDLLKDRISILEEKLKSGPSQPTDAKTLYQDGRSVAISRNPSISVPDQAITFPVVTASDPLDFSKSFEFRDFR